MSRVLILYESTLCRDRPNDILISETTLQSLKPCLDCMQNVNREPFTQEMLRLFFVSVIEVIERAKTGGGTAKEPEPSPAKKKRLA
jgi:hypothetical protein